MIELTKAADVYMITMNDGPNMIDPNWQVRMIEVLEALEAATMQLLRAKLPPAAARDALLTGKRYMAAEAIAAGIADGEASEGDLLTRAIALAASLAVKERSIFTTLKRNLYGDVGAALTMDAAG